MDSVYSIFNESISLSLLPYSLYESFEQAQNFHRSNNYYLYDYFEQAQNNHRNSNQNQNKNRFSKR